VAAPILKECVLILWVLYPKNCRDDCNAERNCVLVNTLRLRGQKSGPSNLGLIFKYAFSAEYVLNGKILSSIFSKQDFPYWSVFEYLNRNDKVLSLS
jgi:hypothetical protein